MKLENLDEDTGLYGVYKMIPHYLEGNCNCGSQFDPNGEAKLNFTGTLYTRMGPVYLEAYDLVCDAGNCKSLIQLLLKRNTYSFLANTHVLEMKLDGTL